jgi:hypothetical protein
MPLGLLLALYPFITFYFINLICKLDIAFIAVACSIKLTDACDVYWSFSSKSQIQHVRTPDGLEALTYTERHPPPPLFLSTTNLCEVPLRAVEAAGKRQLFDSD